MRSDRHPGVSVATEAIVRLLMTAHAAKEPLAIAGRAAGSRLEQPGGDATARSRMQQLADLAGGHMTRSRATDASSR